MTDGPVTYQPHDPALSVLAQCERMKGYIQTADLATRRAEVDRLIGFCEMLLRFWDAYYERKR
jgi:hypothetical protein